MLEPMSAYERRIIHSEVQGIEGVATNSIGSDNNRKIVIYVTNEKPAVTETEDEATLTEEPILETANETADAEASVEAVEDAADETVKEEADAEL